VTRRSRLKAGAPVQPALCGCGRFAPTIQAEWQRPEGVRIITRSWSGKESETLSEGHWETRFLCDPCAAQSVLSDDPPRRMTRVVPDRLVDVLYGKAKRMPRNDVEERKARGW
jgi:hypothetical protein